MVFQLENQRANWSGFDIYSFHLSFKSKATRQPSFASCADKSRIIGPCDDSDGHVAVALMKLGSNEHMEQFRTGLVALHEHPAYFRDIEADTARGDRHSH